MSIEEIESKCSEDTEFIQPRECYDEAIVDVKNHRLVYDFEKLVECQMDHDHSSYFEAIEWIEYNILRTIQYLGQYKPIIKYEDMEDSESDSDL